MIHCQNVYRTVTVHTAVLPSFAVAVTVADPLPAAVSSPSSFTITTDESLLCHCASSEDVNCAVCL